MISQTQNTDATALLLSGGLDSAILLGHLLDRGFHVQPIYVTTGCIWQSAEQQAIRQFMKSLENNAIEPLVELAVPMADLYGKHWSMTGNHVPDESTADEAVYLWGRNPLLLGKAMLWCSLNGISRLALATLRCNPFADATPKFFKQYEQSLSTATGAEVKILSPFAKMSKEEVLKLGDGLPLQRTFSCLAPKNGQHCGTCNKCAERAKGLRSLPNGDPTVYANERHLIDQLS